MITLWNILFYKPLYNALVYLVDIVPHESLFVAVIILTILVRLLISPLSYRALKTQLKTKALQPKLKALKKSITDKQELAKETLALYRTEGVNPFSSFLLILIQFPIIIALYWVFKDGGVEIDPELLYSFVPTPENMSLTALGIDLSEKSYVLAFLAGLTQYIHLAISANFKNDGTAPDTDQEKMMAMVGKSMKYTLPVMITIFSYIIGGAVALYWVTSNVFMIGQEIYLTQKIRKNKEKKSLA